jgi:hypothetical protein
LVIALLKAVIWFWAQPLIAARLKTAFQKKGSGYSLYLFFAICESKKKDATTILCAGIKRMQLST